MIEASRTNECISGDHFNDGGIEKVDTSRLCTHYDDRVDNTICAIDYSAAGDVVSFSFYDKSTMKGFGWCSCQVTTKCDNKIIINLC